MTLLKEWCLLGDTDQNDEKSYVLEEVGVYPPTYPHMGGEIDALVRTFNGYVAVEFKGLMNGPKLTLADRFVDLEPHLAQMVLYSFLLGWVDVLFVWAERGTPEETHWFRTNVQRFSLQEPALLRSKYFNFSKKKPFEKELKDLSMNFYIEYFMKNVAAPYFFKKEKEVLKENERVRLLYYGEL